MQQYALESKAFGNAVEKIYSQFKFVQMESYHSEEMFYCLLSVVVAFVNSYVK